MITNRNEIPVLLNELGLFGRGAEVGVFRGEFAEVILQSWKGSQLILVDPWRNLEDYLDSWNLSDKEAEDNYMISVDRLSRFSGRVRILRMRSEEAAAKIPDGFLDFVYIDANHSYTHSKKDLELWYPKVRSGGVFSGHDYFDALADAKMEPDFSAFPVGLDPSDLTSYGVKSAVDEFAQGHATRIFVTQEEHPSWLILKPHSANGSASA